MGRNGIVVQTFGRFASLPSSRVAVLRCSECAGSDGFFRPSETKKETSARAISQKRTGKLVIVRQVCAHSQRKE